EPSLKHQLYLRELDEWTQSQAKIRGDEETPGTVVFFKNLLDEIDLIPEKLATAVESRDTKSREIFEKISGLAETYRELYGAVKRFIEDHPVAKNKLLLNFEVSIEETGFESRFFDQVSHGVAGSFLGIEEGQKTLKSIIKKYDFNKWDDAQSFAHEVV